MMCWGSIHHSTCGGRGSLVRFLWSIVICFGVWRSEATDECPTMSSGEVNDPTGYCTDGGNWPELRQILLQGGSPVLNCHRFYFGNTSAQRASRGVLVGGLLPINIRPPDEEKCVTVTQSRASLTMQLVEGFLLAAEMAREELNSTGSLVQDFLTGVEIRDTCFDVQYSLGHAIAMAKRSPKSRDLCQATHTGSFVDVYRDAVQYSDESSSCAASLDAPEPRVAAIVGPGISRTVEVSGPTLSVLKLPHVTYWATSGLFSDKEQFPFLFRTVPSDQFQARAMAHVVQRFGWRYVYALASNDQILGGQGLGYFREAVKELGNDYCIAYETQFHDNDAVKIREIVRRIVLGHSGGRESAYKDPSVVMLFAGFGYAEALFKGFRIESLQNANDSVYNVKLRALDLVWLASDGWANRASAIVNAAGIGTHRALGFVFSIPQKYETQQQHFAEKLDTHLRNLKPTQETVRRNPWLGLLWQGVENCLLPFVDANCSRRNDCCDTSKTADTVFNRLTGFTPPLSSGSLWLATKTVVNAVNRAALNNPSCGNGVSGDALRAAVEDTQLECGDASNSPLRCNVFDRSQDVEAAFRIQSWYKHPESGTVAHVFGSWSNVTGFQFVCNVNGTLNQTCLQRVLGVSSPPVSRCSDVCPPGKTFEPAKELTRTASGTCCWLCMNCSTHLYTNTSMSTECLDCPYGMIANEAQDGCVPIEILHRGFSDPLGVVIVVLSVLGIILVASTWLVFYNLHDHEIVRESGGKQNVMMFVTLVLAYMNAIYLLQTPTCFFCISSSITTASIILLIMSLLITRSLRLMWIGKSELNPGRILQFLALKCGHFIKGQLIFVGLVQVFIGVGMHSVWMIVNPHCQTVHNETEVELHLVCEETASFKFTSLAVILFWMLTTLIMVVKARKVTDLGDGRRNSTTASLSSMPQRRGLAVQEAKLLLFAALALSVLFTALTPTFSVTIRVLWPLIIGLSLICEATAVWCCLYLPRLYVMRSAIKAIIQTVKQEGILSHRNRSTSTATTTIDRIPNGAHREPNGTGLLRYPSVSSDPLASADEVRRRRETYAAQYVEKYSLRPEDLTNFPIPSLTEDVRCDQAQRSGQFSPAPVRIETST